MGTRLTQLEVMLAARTKPDGKPIPGFKKNVAAIHRAISRLQTRKNPGEGHGG